MNSRGLQRVGNTQRAQRTGHLPRCSQQCEFVPVVTTSLWQSPLVAWHNWAIPGMAGGHSGAGSLGSSMLCTNH